MARLMNITLNLFVLLILGAFAVGSSRSDVRTSKAFVPRRSITDADTITTTQQHIADLKQADLNVRGGAIPTPTASELTGSAIFLILDHLFRKAFQAKGISFPSQLGGCCILFVFMNLLEVIKSGLGDGIFAFLTPGAGFLGKWLPVFFVPGLAMLPLAPSMGSPVEVRVVTFIYYDGFWVID